MKKAISALFFVSLIYVAPAIAEQYLDNSFLKEEPYRKTKQKVDISSLQTAHDLSVAKEAINPIMRFVIGMSFAELPAAVNDKLLTDHGRTVLQRPPLRNELKRYSVAEINNWHVCDENKISFSASFSDLLQKNQWKEDFFFVRTDDGWRFDDHHVVQC